MIPKNKIKIYVVSATKQLVNIIEKMSQAEDFFEMTGVSFDFTSAVQASKKKGSNIIIIDTSIAGFDAEKIIEKLAAEHPAGVIFLSAMGKTVSVSKKVLPYDFVVKPEFGDQNTISFNGFLKELVVKIKILSTAKVEKTGLNYPEKKSPKLIAIGASTGGVEAIQNVLTELPDELPGIVIVQHMPPNFSRLFAERLNTLCRLRIKEAKDGEEIRVGSAIIAAGDKHMKVVKAGDKYSIRCYSGERVSGHCPSVDVLFESVAEAAGSNALGVIMTGMGADGAKGMLTMKRKGAYTIGQDKESCVIYGMPMEAFKLGGVTKQVSLKDIAGAIIEWSK